MKNEVGIFIVKINMEIVINKSLCEEVEFLRFCFFFILKKRNLLQTFLIKNNNSIFLNN